MTLPDSFYLTSLDLAKHDYELLVQTVRAQLVGGRDRDLILADFQSLRVDGQEEGVDKLEGDLMHVMDRLYGFCLSDLAL